MARLFVLSGASIGATFDLDETSTIGRGDAANIRINEASVSRTHARLVPRPEPGQWKVIDLDSSNGVFIGGKRVKSGIVSDGDTFRLGELELRLRDEGARDADDGGFESEGAFPDSPEAPELEVATPGEFELEFEGDLDDAIASQVAAPAPAPTRAGSKAVASAAAAKSRRRQEALGAARPSAGAQGGFGGNPAGNPSGGGKPVLQYASRNHRASGADLSQLSSPMRFGLIALALLVAGAIAYGAFTLTRTARNQPAVLSGDDPGLESSE